MKSLAERVRFAREKKGLKPSELAEQAGLSHSGINLIEAGTRKHLRVETLAAIACVLEVSMEWLVTGNADQTGPQSLVTDDVAVKLAAGG